MATHRVSILTQATLPDSSGNCWREPLPVIATNDVWRYLVWRFKESGTARIGLHGQFHVPKNYVGTAKVIIVWTAVVTTNNAVWDFDYRAVGGNDAESLDQAGTQESVTVTDAAPGAALRRMEVSITLTSANFAVDDSVQFALFRDLSDAADTLAADAILENLFFEYNDV